MASYPVKFKSWVLLSTYLVFLVNHASRKVFPATKKHLSTTWRIEADVNGTEVYPTSLWREYDLFSSSESAAVFLGVMDALFMVVYGVVMIISGVVGDRTDPRYLLAIGMWLGGVAQFAFGALSEWMHLYSIPWYIFTYSLYAVGQGMAWPNLVTVVANWYGHGRRGFVMGLWSTSQYLGHIVASPIIAYALYAGYDAPYAMFAGLQIWCGFIAWFSIISSPTDLKLYEVYAPEEVHKEKEGEEGEPPVVYENISVLTAIMLPGVLAYLTCTACLKFVNYALFSWQPFYLDNRFKMSESVADDLSLFYDAGAALGSICLSSLSDYIGHRSPVISTSLTVSLGGLFIYAQIPGKPWMLSLAMVVLGFLIGGPYTMIISTIASDLGKQPVLAGNPKAMSTVAALIDGPASIGAAIGQVTVPIIAHAMGWNSVFYLFIVMLILSTLAIGKIIYADFAIIFRKLRGGKVEPAVIEGEGREDVHY